MLLRGHFQNAYVTRDIRWAMAHLTDRYGLSDWIDFEIELPLRTPHGDALQATKVGISWAAGLQVELIEPVSGYIEPYLPYLPADAADPTPRFHHVAVRRESVAEIEREIAGLGAPIALQGGNADVDFAYLDARASLGHYVEFVCATEAGWRVMGWPEGRPRG
jgi:hypothetical protein